MDNVGLVVAASMLLALLILVARELRRRLGIFRWFFIPTSVIAGLLGLCLGPQVVGRLYEEGTLLSQGVFPPAVVETWRQMPGILINFVFAAMFLGKALPPRRSLWRSGGPQTLLGCAIAFGHYALGLFAVLVILRPLTGITPLSGMLLEISLSGGHGTAAGLTAVFTELGFPEGLDMALGLATIGLLSAVIFGTLFINIALRSDAITIAREEFTKDEERYELSALQDNENIEVKSASDTTSDPLTIHFALLSLAMLIGELLRRSLVLFEQYTYGPFTGKIMDYVPLFPLAMIGGAILQIILVQTGRAQQVSRELINRIAGVCLDFIIVSALATLSLSSIGENWIAFTGLALVGVLWTIFCFWVLAPRMLPDRWFERGIGDFGQGTGMVASGLLLMRMADPHNKSGAFESFGSKQLLFEPLLGGGLITAIALPLCAKLGAPFLMIFFSIATVAVIAAGRIFFGPVRKNRSGIR